MRTEDRQRIREEYACRCGYCGIREQDVGGVLTIDHFQPRSSDGADSRDNLVYCCHACNQFKGDYWQPMSERRVLHPSRDDVAAHVFEENDGTLRALSATGAFHIERLHLNRPGLVAHRRELRLLAEGGAERQALLARFSQLEERIDALQARMSGLTARLGSDDTPLD